MVDYRVQVPRYWRNIEHYYRLVGARCRRCGKTYYPPRARCTCGNASLEKVELLGRGRLLSFTVLHQVPIDHERFKPLVIGLVEVNGVRILAQITDVHDVSNIKGLEGATVEPVFRAVKRDDPYGIVCYGCKFRVVRP